MNGGQNAAEQTLALGRAAIINVLNSVRLKLEALDGSGDVPVPTQGGRPC
jgi:hypothetical protein